MGSTKINVNTPGQGRRYSFMASDRGQWVDLEIAEGGSHQKFTMTSENATKLAQGLLAAGEKAGAFSRGPHAGPR